MSEVLKEAWRRLPEMPAMRMGAVCDMKRWFSRGVMDGAVLYSDERGLVWDSAKPRELLVRLYRGVTNGAGRFMMVL
jgi:hypothetical protein